MRPRAKGVVAVEPKEPTGALYLAAKAILASKAKAKGEREAKWAATPVPNRICYAGTAFKNWKPGMPVPPCRVCGDLLHPEENHVCPGFKPKYVEHDEASHERQEARREEIRASKTKAVPTCDECGAEMPTLEDGQWHEEYCVTDETRIKRHEDRLQARYANHNAVNGDEDDLSGYEDEPEEDYCEGEDDGYDCD